MKTALICGVSGQDGAYLAQFLLRKGYTVHGGTRAVLPALLPASPPALPPTGPPNLRRLGIADHVQVHAIDLNDAAAVRGCLAQLRPDEIYYLAGQSSVGLSFQAAAATLESHTVGTLNLLEAIRQLGLSTRYYNACSSECFGNTGEVPADETTPFAPRSPYATAKVAAYWEATRYRQAHGLYVCSGILFNHESPLRPEHFVTRKVVAAACRIAAGSGETLALGDLEVQRDWGWAPEYVEAMWGMLQQETPDDFVVATGRSHSLREFVAATFAVLDLDWQRHVGTSSELLRPAEIHVSRANPAKAAARLGWRADYGMREVIAAMVAAEQERLRARGATAA